MLRIHFHMVHKCKNISCLRHQAINRNGNSTARKGKFSHIFNTLL